VLPHNVPTVRVDDVPADAVLLDVREPEEWAAGRIAGAVHIPMNRVPHQLKFDAGAVTPDASIVVVCKVGGRSAAVTAWLRNQGYDAVNLEGGMLAWEQARRPMEADGGVPPHVV
jgi:rhodanese-related sulfurtransferase